MVENEVRGYGMQIQAKEEGFVQLGLMVSNKTELLAVFFSHIVYSILFFVHLHACMLVYKLVHSQQYTLNKLRHCDPVCSYRLWR